MERIVVTGMVGTVIGTVGIVVIPVRIPIAAVRAAELAPAVAVPAVSAVLFVLVFDFALGVTRLDVGSQFPDQGWNMGLRGNKCRV